MKVTRKWLKEHGFTLETQYAQFVRLDYDDCSIYNTHTQFYNGVIWVREIIKGAWCEITDMDKNIEGASYWVGIDNIGFDYLFEKVGDLKRIIKAMSRKEELSISLLEEQVAERKTHLDKVKTTYKV